MIEPKAESRIALFDFVWTLVRTDFKVRYHGAIGGFIWALLKPIGVFIVLYRVFHFLFHGNAYMMNLLVGLFLWQFFSEGTMTGLMSIAAKGYLVTRVRFPRWIVVVVSLANSFITLLVYSVGLLVIVWLSGKSVSLTGLLFYGIYIVLYATMVVGFALGASVLYVQYRDLNQVWDIVLQAGFFLAPIVYPMDVIPERYHFWLYAWPATPIIQFSRSVLVDGHIPSLRAHLLLLGVAGGMLGVGALLFASRSAAAIERL